MLSAGVYVFCADDKKLTTTLKRIGVTNIPAIEEVNMFKNDGEVIHFVGPKGKKNACCVDGNFRGETEVGCFAIA